MRNQIMLNIVMITWAVLMGISIVAALPLGAMGGKAQVVGGYLLGFGIFSLICMIGVSAMMS